MYTNGKENTNINMTLRAITKSHSLHTAAGTCALRRGQFPIILPGRWTLSKWQGTLIVISWPVFKTISIRYRLARLGLKGINLSGLKGEYLENEVDYYIYIHTLLPG